MAWHQGKFKLDKQMRCHHAENAIFHFTRHHSPQGERDLYGEEGNNNRASELEERKTMGHTKEEWLPKYYAAFVTECHSSPSREAEKSFQLAIRRQAGLTLLK